MTSLWQTPAVVMALLAWLASPPTSLVDAARHEAVRRQLAGQSRSVYTNQTLPAPRPSDVAAALEPASPPPGVSGGPASAGEAAPTSTPAAVQRPPSDQSPPLDDEAWRQRAAALRTAIEQDGALVEGLQSRVAGLQRDVTSRDDPAQRAVLRQELDRALADLERAKAKAKLNADAVQAMKTEARRLDIPPGWLR